MEMGVVIVVVVVVIVLHEVDRRRNGLFIAKGTIDRSRGKEAMEWEMKFRAITRTILLFSPKFKCDVGIFFYT